MIIFLLPQPLRTGLVSNPSKYQWSSHGVYLDNKPIPWLTTEMILSQFAKLENKARKLYYDFVQEGMAGAHRNEFHSGTCQGRILGDENFSEKAVALAEEKWKNRSTLSQIIDAVCLSYGIGHDIAREKTTRR